MGMGPGLASPKHAYMGMGPGLASPKHVYMGIIMGPGLASPKHVYMGMGPSPVDTCVHGYGPRLGITQTCVHGYEPRLGITRTYVHDIVCNPLSEISCDSLHTASGLLDYLFVKVGCGSKGRGAPGHTEHGHCVT